MSRRAGYHRHGSSGSGSGGGYHDLFPEDPCSRSEDNGFRSYQSGRYGGSGYRNNNNREAGGCFRRSSWDSSDLLRQNHDSPATQGSIADSLSHPSSHLLPYDDKHDEAGGGGDHGMRAGQRQDRDLDHSLGSLAWKSLKWNRSSSFSSSSKVLRSESDEGRLEVLLPPGRETPIESPVASPLSLDEGLSRKKQRLGWGQGLAKYERAKTEGSDEVCGRHPSQSDDASPRVVVHPGNTSPATPASVTCSSSHGESRFMRFSFMWSQFVLFMLDGEILPGVLSLYSFCNMHDNHVEKVDLFLPYYAFYWLKVGYDRKMKTRFYFR